MKFTLTIQERHLNELRDLIILDDKLERPAIMLCGRSSINNDFWDGGTEERFLSYQVIPIPEDEIIENSEVHVNWETTTLRRAMKLAKQKDFALCIVHNHPNESLQFSEVDNENEPQLFKGIFNQNGGEKPHTSIVITPTGSLFGRVWTKNLSFQPLSLIRVLGEKYVFHFPDKHKLIPKDIFHRQQLAFGASLNNDLSILTVGIIGCGATGSATAHLLSRLGIGKMLLIDDDLVERTNLSRLYGASVIDADAGRPKVEVLKDFITGAGIGTRVRAIKDWVGSKKCRSALKSCDIIFGCTDDNSGRIFLNRFAHFYLAPVFDMGIVIVPDETNHDILRSLQGRLTIIETGNTCLLCRKIIDPIIAAEEDMKRTDPTGFERRKDEGYIQGVSDPSPAVITFTTEISCVAVNELINRITGYKKIGNQKSIMRFFDQGKDRKPGAEKREGCPICDNKYYWGLGDITPFMDQAN